jgi:hypothetical protein
MYENENLKEYETHKEQVRRAMAWTLFALVIAALLALSIYILSPIVTGAVHDIMRGSVGLSPEKP